MTLTNDIRNLLTQISAKCDEIDAGGVPPSSNPTWLPLLNDTAPFYFSDHINNHHWYNGSEQASFNAMMTAMGTTFNGQVNISSKGLHTQGARTNILWPSNGHSNARWVKGNCTATLNDTTAPDGTATATKLTETTANGFHEMYQAITISSGQAYTHSIHVKAGTATKGRVWFVNGGYGYYADFDLSSGTIGAATNFNGGSPTTPIQSFIEELSNGWYRVGVSGIGASLTTGYFDIALRNSAGAVQYTGTGNYLYIWEAQTEQGRFPSTQIKTSTAQVTRAQESMIRNITSPAELTKVIKARTAPAFAADYDVLWHMDANVGNLNYNDIEIFRDNAGHLFLRVTWHQNTHYEIDFGVMANNTDFTLAFSVSASGLVASLNGGAAQTVSVANFPTNLIKDRHGINMEGVREWYGSIYKDFTFSSLATASQLQAFCT